QYLAYRPQDTAALVQYARTLHKLSDSPAADYRAFLVLEQAVRRAPNDWELRREAADLAEAVGRFHEAVGHYPALLQRSPRDPRLWQNLGWCQENFGKAELAEDSYRKSIELDPHVLLSHARLGNLLIKLHRSSEVPAVLEEMVAANPTSTAALLARADYLKAVGLAEQAGPDIDKAYQLAPGQLAVIQAKAALEEKNGRLNQARAVLKKGLDQHPGHPSLFEALARVELKAGQTAQAVHWLMQELMLRPDNLALRFQVFDLS